MCDLAVAGQERSRMHEPLAPFDVVEQKPSSLYKDKRNNVGLYGGKLPGTKQSTTRHPQVRDVGSGSASTFPEGKQPRRVTG